MMYLLDYLKHSPPDDAEFLEKFGVRVVREDDLYLFKYTSSAKFDLPLVRECRGVILRNTPDGWEVASRPFDKFFNHDQGHCPLYMTMDDVLASDPLAIELHEKADGTCIQVWWDTARETWRASTLGTITTSAVNGGKVTFEELFWEVSDFPRERLDGGFRRFTYIFELCTPHNRIVTQYAEVQAVLLGTRDKVTGDFHPETARGETLSTFFAIESGGSIRAPVVHKRAFRTKQELLDYVEQESKSDAYGKNPEGFVGYMGGCPVVKFKNERYKQLHTVGGGDLVASRKRVKEAVFLGTLDDIQGALLPELVEYAAKVKDAYSSALVDAMAAHTRVMARAPFDSRRDFALAVKETFPPDLASWAFRQGPEPKGVDVVMRTFDEWLLERGRYERMARFEVSEAH